MVFAEPSRAWTPASDPGLARWGLHRLDPAAGPHVPGHLAGGLAGQVGQREALRSQCALSGEPRSLPGLLPPLSGAFPQRLSLVAPLCPPASLCLPSPLSHRRHHQPLWRG